MKRIIEILILILATTTPAIAEVMDKELSSPAIWGIAVLCSAFGFAATRFKPKYAILTTVVALVLFGGVVAELHNPSVGKAIQAEAGNSYPAQVYTAITVVVISNAIGFVLRKVKQQRMA